MAEEEQLSVCWSDFNNNLSAGCRESLRRGELVDVILAAEGQIVKAHRLVLSVCSPYFRKLFTQIPQHACVFLKDVSYTALKDLIQFMYCGEVNVKQEALPAFLSTAEALQIKGLTDQSPAEPSAQPIISTGTTIKTTAVTHKRSSVGGAPHIKRTKNTIDPLEREITTDVSGTAGTENITVPTAAPEPKSQQTSGTENFDLTMEIWVKEEAGDVDSGDHDGTYYVENDENYFPENEDGGPKTTLSSGTTNAVTTATKSYFNAGDHNNSSGLKKCILRENGVILLVHNNYIYRSNRKSFGKNKDTKYWTCVQYSPRCRSRFKTIGEKILITHDEHSHSDHQSRIEKARQNNLVTYKSLSAIRQLETMNLQMIDL